MCLHPTACQHRRICGRPDQGFIYLRGNFFPRGQNQGRKHGTILRKDENHIWLGAQITPYFGCQGYRLSQERHFVQVHQMNGTSQLAVQFGLLRGVGLEPPPLLPRRLVPWSRHGSGCPGPCAAGQPGGWRSDPPSPGVSHVPNPRPGGGGNAWRPARRLSHSPILLWVVAWNSGRCERNEGEEVVMPKVRRRLTAEPCIQVATNCDHQFAFFEG